MCARVLFCFVFPLETVELKRVQRQGSCVIPYHGEGRSARIRGSTSTLGQGEDTSSNIARAVLAVPSLRMQDLLLHLQCNAPFVRDCKKVL